MNKAFIRVLEKIAKRLDENQYDHLSKKEKLATDLMNFSVHKNNMCEKGERLFIIKKEKKDIF